jgi:hypothetical protein
VKACLLSKSDFLEEFPNAYGGAEQLEAEQLQAGSGAAARRGAEQLQAGGGAAGGGELHFWKLIASLLLIFLLLRGRLWCSAPRASLPWRYRVVLDDGVWSLVDADDPGYHLAVL